MARRKTTIVQRDFTYMEMREDFLEGDDLQLRLQSLKGASNVKSLATRAIEARPGTFFKKEIMDADNIIEIRPASSTLFGLIINRRSFDIIDETGRIVFSEDAVPWLSAEGIWTQNFRETTIIGGESIGLYELLYNKGSWSFSRFEFEITSGARIAQPYWAYEKDKTIQPSAVEGSIVVTASKPVWTNNYVGLRIRYGLREIEITEYITSTVVKGNVIGSLPPSFSIGVVNGSDFRVGDAVVSENTNYQGFIVAIAGSVLSVVTTAFFDGPDVNEILSSPSGSSKITSKTLLAPLASPIWDEPLMSKVRGFPRASSAVSGRLVLNDFPQIPDLLALSSARNIRDFEAGVDDDDAIVRQAGDNAPRWLHAVNMGDLLLLADNGFYYVPARDNGIISPTSFNTVFVDEVGSSEIKPVKIDDGVIFVEASGEKVSAALLDGNVYLKWSVRKLTTYHEHLVKSPTRLCGPSLENASPEKYIFIVNLDGTLAAMSWHENIRDENIGFVPWTTQGSFVNVSPIFNGYWTIVDREIGSETKRYLEAFSDDAFLDCAVETSLSSEFSNLDVNGETLQVNGNNLTIQSPPATHLANTSVTYYARGWDAGDHLINSDGTVDNEPAITGSRQIGLNFEAKVAPWPMEFIESGRLGMIKSRVIRTSVSIQNTLGFAVRCNNTTVRVGSYGFGDDLSEPPVPKTKVHRFSVFGNRDHPEIEYIKERPGPFRILSIGQEVQY